MAATLDELRSFSPLVENDGYARITPEGSLNARDHYGATARVRAAIARAKSKR